MGRRAGEPVQAFSPAALRRLRQAGGWTLDALGAQAGATRSSLIAYEKGSRRPGMETMRSLATALGVDPRELTAPRAEGSTLTDLRVGAGLTKAELASRLGLARTTWDLIERGTRPLRLARAARLATWFGVGEREVMAAARRVTTAAPTSGTRLRNSHPIPPPPLVAPQRRAPAGGFVGRDRQLKELREQLAGTRLLTLTGTAGVGKTRLAGELSRRVAGCYAAGARLVELATIRDPALVPQAVATALRVREQPGLPLTRTLCANLRDAHLLLVVDNCEHLVEACAGLVRQLLEACPRVSCLATSQQPLGIGGERLWSVPPLTVPPAPQAGGDAAASEAVQLFVERAVAAHRGFVLNPSVTPAVADICRRLDGIPLAIELAAARVGVLTPTDIVARLDDRFAMLTDQGTGTLDRHRTLQGALEWSHNLLSAAERTVLRRLSVFANGCDLEAVEAVCGGDLGGDERVLDPLAALVAKSLVGADTSGERARYRLLETVRLYAADRLAEAGEAAELRSRHGHWCLSLAEAAEVGLTGPDQLAWLDRLDGEHDNLRVALDWAATGGGAEAALRLAGALTLFWRVRGHFREGRARLEEALALAGEADPRVLARAHRGVGFLALMLDDIVGALPGLERALELDRQVGDAQGQARSLLLLGNVRLITDPAGPLTLLEESVELARRTGDRWCLGHGIAMLAMGRVKEGKPDAARSLLEECVRDARAAGELQSLRIGLHILGNLALSRGELDAAESLLTEGLEITRKLGEPFDSSAALLSLGLLAARRGDAARARTLLEESLAFARQTGKPGSIAGVLCALGSLALDEDDDEAARRLFEESAAMYEGAGLGSPLALLGLGELAAGHDEAAKARRLYADALDLARDRGDRLVMARALCCLARLDQQAGEPAAAAARHHEALRLRLEGADRAGLAESLESIASLAVGSGHWDDAARLLGAAHSQRDRGVPARSRSRRREHEATRAAVEARLGAERLAELWAQGAALSAADAVAFAQRRRRVHGRATTGWGSLTGSERGVAALVAEGLTNAQISERLCVTRSTVEWHLSHIFGKLQLESRSQLVRESLRRELASGD